jgi:2-(3-amino-3-carboxypropyl)histidine synthase
MEEDRDQVDLGRAVEVDLEADYTERPRIPKKRFVGRRAAGDKVGGTESHNGSVENAGAVQGMGYITNLGRA